MITDHNTRNGLAPSIMAASSNSRGSVMKYWRSRNVSYGLVKKEGIISGSQVPTQPIFVKNVKVGMTVTVAGRNNTEIRMTNRKSRPGKRKREKPYATRMQETKTPIVVVNAYRKVFHSTRG